MAGPATTFSLHGRVEEALRGDDPQPVRQIVVRDDPAEAAEVVDVAVRVDHRAHGPPAEVLRHQLERGPRGLRGGERVDDDPPGLPRDERDVGDVGAADLVDAVADLEEAVLGVQPRLPPEARVDLGRAVLAEERPGARVPDGLAVRAADRPGERRDAAAGGQLRVARVVEWQGRGHRVVQGRGGGRGFARLHSRDRTRPQRRRARPAPNRQSAPPRTASAGGVSPRIAQPRKIVSGGTR